MDVGLGVPVDRVASLLQSLKVGNAQLAQEGILQLYAELKECYETQERAAPAEYAGEQDEDVKQACKQASLLFVARVLFATQQKDGEPQPLNLGCSISRIVSAAGINLLDFFREVNVVVSKLSPYFEARGGSSKLFSQQAQLKENSETVVVMGLLAKKYKDNFNMFLHQLDFYKQLVMRLGWNAFLVLRIKLLSAFPDVVSCVELLPCIFAILASHAPRLPDCLSQITRESRGQLLLKSMSEMCKADYVRVRARMASVEALLTQIFTTAVSEWRAAVAAAKLEAAQPNGTGATAPAGTLDLVASPVLEGLVTDPERMNLVVAALEQEYEQHYSRGGSELDEREFLATDFSKFASPRFSPGQMHSAMSKFRGGATLLRPGALLGPGAHTTAPSQPPMSHPTSVHMRMEMVPGLHSPLPTMHLAAGGGPVGTPVSEAMGTSAWLRSMTANMPAEPSATLQHFLAAVPLPSTSAHGPGAVSAAQQMARRVRDMVASVIPEENAPALLGPFPVLQPSLMAERRTEAMKLYYHSLDAILLVEEKANGITGVTALLSSAKFHRGLIACCVEVVSACYRMVGCAFPKVLDVLRIKAFDLVKMIQSFVKNVPNLPRELKRHLFLIEEKILECLAWEPGSSLYPLIMNVHSENEAAQEAADRAAAFSAATSAIDSQQRTTTGGAVAPSSSTAGAAGGGVGASAAAAESQDADAPPAQPQESSGAPAKEAVEEGGPAAATAGAPAAPAPALPGAAGPVAPPMSPKRPQGAAFTGLMSPAKKARGMAGASYSTQPFSELLPVCIGAPPAGAPLAGTSAGALYDFSRKVLKLASFRLAVMCENFDFSPLERSEVACKVYETIEYAMYRQTHLFYNRHIDQIMLSALYGYCKVHKLAQVSFREIIAQYRKQPQACQAIFRSVVIEQSNPGLQISSRADIIAFYNQVFVPAMKGFLLKGDAGNSSMTSGPGNASTDSKPGGAASSAHGTPAGSSAGWGSAGGVTLGLPPLPPRSASHSPRASKLPPPLPAAPLPPRMTAKVAVANPQGANDGELAGRDCGGKADRDTDVVKVEEVCSQIFSGSISSTHPSPSPKSEATGSRQPSSSQASGSAQCGKASGVRTRAAAAMDHYIPDGLAALLQALDSQQTSEGKEEDVATGGTRHGPVTRSGRTAAAMDVAGGTDGSRDRAPGRERRSARHPERRDDAVDVDGPSSPDIPALPGRRQRTPNRRYGND